MKTYTFEVEIEEGYDEFWDSKPDIHQVQEVIEQEMWNAYPHVKSIKMIKFVHTDPHFEIEAKKHSEE